ncbi:MAG: ATP-binding protein [Anaerolineae bacterium]|jgi:signal transduction histidine kinase
MADERILVADDETRIVELCVQLLTKDGYHVRGVTSGHDAIACLEADSYDLLIVDIRMPDVDGLTVLRVGLAMDPNLTSVVITGYATMGRVIEALNSGARGFLLKPFNIDELNAAVESALAQRQKEQEWLRLRAQLPILVISQTLMTAGDVRELSRRLLEVVTRQMGVSRAVLALLADDTGDLQIAAAVGLPEESTHGVQIPWSSALEEVLHTREVLMLEPHTLDDLDHSLRELACEPRSGNLVLVPLRTGKKDVGLLCLNAVTSRGRPVALSPSDLNLLSIMGGQIAIALENGRMYAMEQQRTAELGRALEQQQELDRLKNEFIQNVSHELRTPLSMILGYAELLAAGDLGPVDEKQQGPLDIIVQRSYTLRDLIGNITAILENESRQHTLQLVQLNSLIDEALVDFQVLADQAGLKISGNCVSPLPPVLGDAEHLRRVVDNLIGNALKFTPAGGRVEVRLRGENGTVLLQVADSGIGIDSDHIGRIFERFYQVDGTSRRMHGGCGLGLALVKEIVEKHGGTVSVHSEPGEGSTFTVSLPISSDASTDVG